MKRITSAVAAAAALGLAGCHPGPAATAHGRSPAPAGALVTPIPPSVVALGCTTWQTGPGATALVHVQTVLEVRHARAPQEGATGRVTVASIDVAFLAGGVPVGWVIQAVPPGASGLVMGNGRAVLTATAYGLYLSGHWTPDCRIVRVYWVPGDHR